MRDPRCPISVIVLTYESASTIERCLTALGPQAATCGAELIVIDNGSTDDTVSIARRPGVEIMEVGQNLGFAGGCNRGAARASGETLLFVNPDCVVDDGAIAAVLEAMDGTDDVGPVGGRGHHPDGRYDPRSVHGRVSVRGALAFACGLDKVFRGSSCLDPEHGPKHISAGAPVRSVTAVSGAFMAIPRGLWSRLGGFDERFFLYGEDVDLCLRASRLGWTPAIAPAAGYTHIGGVSSGNSRTRGELLYRGKVELYRRHLSASSARIAVWGLKAGTALRAAPSLAPFPSLAARAHPWRELFRSRAQWSEGYGRGRSMDCST